MPPLHIDIELDSGGDCVDFMSCPCEQSMSSSSQNTMKIELQQKHDEPSLETIQMKRRRRTNNTSRPKLRNTSTMLAMTALLLIGSSAGSSVDNIPDGLLFSSEMGGSTSFDSLRGGSASSMSSSSSTTYSSTSATYSITDESQYSSEEETSSTRRHPIHRIYQDGASTRRRVEELENTLQYYQTGIRGDPNHQLDYGPNHPFDLKRKERELQLKIENNEQLTQDDERFLQEGTEQQEGGEGDTNPFKPIRIHFDTSALDSQLSETNSNQINFVKNTILPRMANYWTEALSVVPVQGNLLVSTAELQGRLYCGDTEFSKVPAEDIANGVPNSDLVLYVSGAPSARFCGPSTLAVAVACNFDQFDRPTAGKFMFCLYLIYSPFCGYWIYGES